MKHTRPAIALTSALGLFLVAAPTSASEQEPLPAATELEATQSTDWCAYICGGSSTCYDWCCYAGGTMSCGS